MATTYVLTVTRYGERCRDLDTRAEVVTVLNRLEQWGRVHGLYTTGGTLYIKAIRWDQGAKGPTQILCAPADHNNRPIFEVQGGKKGIRHRWVEPPTSMPVALLAYAEPVTTATPLGSG